MVLIVKSLSALWSLHNICTTYYVVHIMDILVLMMYDAHPTIQIVSYNRQVQWTGTHTQVHIQLTESNTVDSTINYMFMAYL